MDEKSALDANEKFSITILASHTAILANPLLRIDVDRSAMRTLPAFEFKPPRFSTMKYYYATSSAFRSRNTSTGPEAGCKRFSTSTNEPRDVIIPPSTVIAYNEALLHLIATVRTRT